MKPLITQGLLFLSLILCSHVYSQIKIGKNVREVSPFALLELESTDKTLLIPRMTTAQRDAAFNAEAPVGLIIYNTDLNSLQFYRKKGTNNEASVGKFWENTTNNKIPTRYNAPQIKEVGSVYFNLSDKTLYIWDGSVWQTVKSEPTNGNNQKLELSGYKLSISGGNTVTLPSGSDSDNQQLNWEPTKKLLSINGGNEVNLNSLQDLIKGYGNPTIQNAENNDVYVDINTGKLYVFNNNEWITPTYTDYGNNGGSGNTNTNDGNGSNVYPYTFNNGIEINLSNQVGLGGTLIRPTEIVTTASNTLAFVGLQNSVNETDLSIVVQDNTTNVIKKIPASSYLNEEITSLTHAQEGQLLFDTPLPIESRNKVNVYRNGIRIDFTVISNSMIEIEAEAICYQNDEIRIVQFY